MPALFVGLMSGTSLDGIDAVLADGSEPIPRVLAADHAPFDADLRAQLVELHAPAAGELHRAELAAITLARAYADSVARTLACAGVEPRAVRAIGCHGQTIRHRPADGYTVQLVNGAWLAELTGITTVCDFRSRDLAAGGQGAPLVPAFHAQVFRSRDEPRAVVNVGGIANVTSLALDGAVSGFDCGPGNALMDGWIAAQRTEPYDRDGAWAASGRVLPVLLERLRAHPFFAAPPPKSAGREQFNLEWVRSLLAGDERPQDVQATLLELTVHGIADAIATQGPRGCSVWLCGGGARNTALVSRLAKVLAPQRVATTAALGVAPEHVEALAFAWLAQRTLAGEAGNIPAVTGARGPRVLGAIYPA
ncbi:MAG: anhydro-N-acetylmuramic acid kinase [Burkholderiales bacterium]